jgi:hypothetical protein
MFIPWLNVITLLLVPPSLPRDLLLPDTVADQQLVFLPMRLEDGPSEASPAVGKPGPEKDSVAPAEGKDFLIRIEDADPLTPVADVPVLPLLP